MLFNDIFVIDRVWTGIYIQMKIEVKVVVNFILFFIFWFQNELSKVKEKKM